MSFLEKHPGMEPENMVSINSHISPELNNPAWSLPQSVNDGFSTNTNSMPHDLQDSSYTTFDSNALYPSLNTPYPTPNILSPVTTPYIQTKGVSSPIGFGGNHGFSFGPGLQPLRPQPAPSSSNSQVHDQTMFSNSNLQPQGPHPMPPYAYPNPPVFQHIPPHLNIARQNVHGRMTYPGTYHSSPRGPTAHTVPGSYSRFRLETPKAHRREKRERETSESDSESESKPKKAKRSRANEPAPEYNIRWPRPPSWGVADDGSPLFVYNDDGQLRTDIKYTAEDIRNYIDNCPRKLKILIQQSPTQVSKRLDDSNKCMWIGCIKQEHKIDVGFFRVAFDEFYKQSKSGRRNPLKPTAVMHLWCYEQCFDPLVDYHHHKLKPDVRRLRKENRNPMGIIHKGKKIVQEALKPWLINSEFSEGTREYTSSLSYALNQYHQAIRSDNKKAEQEKNKGRTTKCKIHVHLGDLMQHCLKNGKLKQDLRQKDLPVNQFQFRPRPEKLRKIFVDEDSDSDTGSEILEAVTEEGGAMALPEERSNALKPLGEKGVNSRTPAAGVGARQKGSCPEADGAENEAPKETVRGGVERGGITREKATSFELKLPTPECSTDPGLVLEDLGSPSGAFSPTDHIEEGTTNITAEEIDRLFEDLPLFEELPVAEELPESKELSEPKKLPEAKEVPEPQELPEPKELPEPNELPEAKEVPEPQELPESKELPEAGKPSDVEDSSGSGGSQEAEAGPSGASC
ncbi:unnamed protein product [Clonostachys rosea]|uniref:Uncharacterized protein n=1 Tax=Bionectria ochroleuca TaxID=29856 RepID=A0ABY6UQ68_BIOOC|nr:unnamed protein product [Clonostachys rosea]